MLQPLASGSRTTHSGSDQGSLNSKMELKLEGATLTGLAVGPPACSTSTPGPGGVLGLRFPDKRPAFPNSLSSFGLLFGDPSSLSVWEAPWVLLMCMALEATFCRSSGLSHPPPPPALFPAQTPRTEPGSMGREHPSVVGFQSDSMSSGEKQLLAASCSFFSWCPSKVLCHLYVCADFSCTCGCS